MKGGAVKKILSWHAPLTGAPTGVADYAETLFGAMGRAAPDGWSIERDAPVADVRVYHLGNNGLHREIYKLAKHKPGIVVIHDAVLHHFFLGLLTEPEYVDEFVSNYGEWNRGLAAELWRDRAASGIDVRYFRHPMLRGAISGARAVIVHNPAAEHAVKKHGARDVRVIPHFFDPPEKPHAAAVEELRARAGAAPGVTLFGIFGYLRETKRIAVCLKAFRRLHAIRQQTVLLIAGDVVSRDLERLLATEDLRGVVRIGHLTDSELLAATAAVDCGLNLRYPSAGETSGIAIRMMGIGKPVILTDGLEISDLPPETCLRVPYGVTEEDSLFDRMALIAEHPEIGRRIGRAAAEHVQEKHSLPGAARAYWDLVAL